LIPRIAQDETKTHLATIEIKSPFNLICADLSKDGKYLAVSDATCLMLFQLTYEVDGETNAIQAVVTNKISLKSSSVRKSCSALKFAPDGSGQLICAHPSGSISVLKIAEESNEDVEINVTLEHTFDDMVVDDDNEENVLFPVTALDISSDGRWMSAGRNGVGSGCIHVFSLADYVHWYVVPALEAPHSCVKFLGGGESVEAALAVGCSNLAFYIFDVRHKRLSDWSADSGFPISNSLPTELTHRNDFPLRFAFNPATPNKFLMVSLFLPS
jgi:WD40 repeat protein